MNAQTHPAYFLSAPPTQRTPGAWAGPCLAPSGMARTLKREGEDPGEPGAAKRARVDASGVAGRYRILELIGYQNGTASGARVVLENDLANGKTSAKRVVFDVEFLQSLTPFATFELNDDNCIEKGGSLILNAPVPFINAHDTHPSGMRMFIASISSQSDANTILSCTSKKDSSSPIGKNVFIDIATNGKISTEARATAHAVRSIVMSADRFAKMPRFTRIFGMSDRERAFAMHDRAMAICPPRTPPDDALKVAFGAALRDDVAGFILGNIDVFADGSRRKLTAPEGDEAAEAVVRDINRALQIEVEQDGKAVFQPNSYTFVATSDISEEVFERCMTRVEFPRSGAPIFVRPMDVEVARMTAHLGGAVRVYESQSTPVMRHSGGATAFSGTAGDIAIRNIISADGVRSVRAFMEQDGTCMGIQLKGIGSLKGPFSKLGGGFLQSAERDQISILGVHTLYVGLAEVHMDGRTGAINALVAVSPAKHALAPTRLPAREGRPPIHDVLNSIGRLERPVHDGAEIAPIDVVVTCAHLAKTQDIKRLLEFAGGCRSLHLCGDTSYEAWQELHDTPYPRGAVYMGLYARAEQHMDREGEPQISNDTKQWFVQAPVPKRPSPNQKYVGRISLPGHGEKKRSRTDPEEGEPHIVAGMILKRRKKEKYMLVTEIARDKDNTVSCIDGKTGAITKAPRSKLARTTVQADDIEDGVPIEHIWNFPDGVLRGWEVVGADENTPSHIIDRVQSLVRSNMDICGKQCHDSEVASFDTVYTADNYSKIIAARG